MHHRIRNKIVLCAPLTRDVNENKCYVMVPHCPVVTIETVALMCDGESASARSPANQNRAFKEILLIFGFSKADLLNVSVVKSSFFLFYPTLRIAFSGQWRIPVLPVGPDGRRHRLRLRSSFCIGRMPTSTRFFCPHLSLLVVGYFCRAKVDELSEDWTTGIPI